MKKQTNALKLTVLAAFVAVLSVGCASTGYARYDDDTDRSVGLSAGAEVGTDADVDVRADLDNDDADLRMRTDLDDSLEENPSTVTALSFVPETRAAHITRFPFYDMNIQVIEVYTFAVPDPDLPVTAATDLPTFSTDLEPGSVFVEAAGGSGELRAGRVIQHSPVPTR